MPDNLFDTPLFRERDRQQAAAVLAEKPAHAAAQRRDQRMYAAAVPSRLNSGFPSYMTSADAELVTSLRNLRSRSRQLVRDAPYAKNAKRVIVNNVIGTGVRLQGLVANTRGSLNQRVNDSIEDAWGDWCDAESCHTGGELHFHDLERMAMGQVFEAGEVFIRIYRQKFGNSQIPLALEVIEAERIVDGYAVPSQVVNGGQVRMGVETDKFRRPVAYWVRDLHPGDIRMGGAQAERAERVLAADIIHLRIIDRWPQTRGEPWLHAVAGKLLDMNGYSDAEITAARGAANYLATIESSEDPNSMGEEQPDGSFQQPLEPGTSMRLLPGEKMNFISPNRPNSAFDAFMSSMLREVAAGVGASYESVGRDYSKSNYSSSRLALLDDRDVWRSMQSWFIRTFRKRLHTEFMTQASIANALTAVASQDYFADPKKFGAAMFRPRGWTWIDPTKEVAAYKEAIKAGFTTVGDVIAATSGGSDLEDVMRRREDELKFMKDLNLVFDTNPEVVVSAETRGQMILTPEGIEPAAVVTAGLMPQGKGLAPGSMSQGTDPEAPPEPAPVPDPEEEQPEVDENGEPVDAEINEDMDDRAMRRRRNLKIIGGYS